MMPATLNFRAALPMVVVMNAIAQVSPASISGPKLDNRRVLAAIVDLLIVCAGAMVVLYAGDSLTSDRQGALGAVVLGWALYYYFALESGAGQTVGKKLMKLRVVRADGRPAGMREVAVRTILRVVDNYLVGLIAMLATGERRQRIGDLAAGTLVVAPPPAPVAEAVVEDEPAAAEPAEAESGPAQTITLPAHPAAPATLADRTEPEEAAAAQPEPLAQEPDAEVQPVPVEPTAEVHDELREADEPVNVKSVETVSAMDLIMGVADAAESQPAQDA